MLGNIECKSSLSYTRTSRQDDQVGLLEASQYPVYISEACFYALDLSALSLELLDLLDILNDDLADICISGPLRLLRDLEDPLLCSVEDISRRKLA